MNVLNRINLILAAMGSKPYTIKELSLEDVLHAGNYFIGIKCLIKNLRKSVELKDPTFMNLPIDVYDKSSSLLYRASSDKGINPFLFTPGERISQGSSNIYTRLISGILPGWRKYPRRNRSVICTNSYFDADSYTEYSTRKNGVIYVVLPPNDAKLVVSPAKDIWTAFKYLDSLDYVDESIATFLGFFYQIITENLINTTTTPPTIDKLKLLSSDEKKMFNADIVKEMFVKQNNSSILDFFNEVDKLLSNRKMINVLMSIYEEYVKDDRLFKLGKYIFRQKMSNPVISVIDVLDELFDPEVNDFNTTTYSAFVKTKYPDGEVWTESPCIFVNTVDRNFLTELYTKYIEINEEIA